MNHKAYRLLACFILFLFQTGILTAQQKTVENKTININNQGLFQIDFTSPINNQTFTSPANASEYYAVKMIKDNRSITLQTNNTTLPPTVLKIEETNGKVWNINIVYKEEIDRENESVFDFADNSVNTGKNNIVLRTTEEKLTLSKQADPIPQDRDMLTKTYPGIDFSSPPPTQTFNLLETGKSSLPFNQELYTKRPGLKMAFKNEMSEIEIICQDIVFDGNNAYLKLLIQNKSNDAFPTGSMLLSLLKQNGTSLNLYPSYIYPAKFPVIKPKFQISLIYAFKAYDVTPDDNLRFQLSDRLQKTNLEFTIPGQAYNDAKKD